MSSRSEDEISQSRCSLTSVGSQGLMRAPLLQGTRVIFVMFTLVNHGLRRGHLIHRTTTSAVTFRRSAPTLQVGQASSCGSQPQTLHPPPNAALNGAHRRRSCGRRQRNEDVQDQLAGPRRLALKMPQDRETTNVDNTTSVPTIYRTPYSDSFLTEKVLETWLLLYTVSK